MQRKLAVGSANDSFEREADRIADQLAVVPAHSELSSAPVRIQRLSGQSDGPVSAAPPSVDRALASPGRPLDPAFQQDMEQRFGHDFSRVRVHSDAAADQSARDVNAKAYAVGHDIVFSAGRFAPGTHEGRRLIGHELTHVVQQSGADRMNVGQGNDKHSMSSGVDTAAGRAVGRRNSADLLSAPSGTAVSRVQRQPTDATMAPSLQILPSALTFEPTKVGRWSIRHLTITNHGEKTIQVASIAGPATVAQHPPAGKGFGGPTAPWPRTFDVERTESGPFEIFYHQEGALNEISPGATAEYQVNFSPTSEGHAESSFTFFDLHQLSLGTVVVSGDGKQTDKDPDENAKATRPKNDVTPSGNQQVDQAKIETLSALLTWAQTADKSLSDYHTSLMKEWADYLGKTASNPTISSANLPGGPSMLAHVAEHTIAGGIAKTAEVVIEHTAEHMAEHATARAVGAVGAIGAGATGAEAGSLAGPVGAVIGFAVGVLIETIAGDLFESLTSEDAELRKALQEEFQYGFKTGAKAVAELMKRKIDDEKKELAKARRYQNGMENQYRKLVLGATGAKRIDRLHAEIEAQTDLAADAKPSLGFSRALLEMWARDHAGTGTKEIPGDQLAEVSEEVRYALEQPDLFVIQCLHEWRKRGLPVTRELEATMKGELRTHGVDEITVSSDESSNKKEHAMALTAQKLFSGREFVWKDVNELQGFGSYRAMTQLRANDVRHGVTIKGGDVYCAPILVVNGASCSVSHFHYRVKQDGLTLGAYSSPGESAFQAYGEATATAEDAGIAVYHLMSELRSYGVAITPKPDALHNPWLQQTFGAQTAVPKLQQTEGQQSRVVVFEGEELLDPTGGGGRVPDSRFKDLANTGDVGPGNNLMIRGGDTILILHGEWK